MDSRTASAPITHVVNTHSDGDHWWGNQLLRDARRITSRASHELMAHESGGPAQLENFKRLAARLQQARPLPLPEAVNRRAADFGSYVGAMLAPFEFSTVEPAAATESFEDRLALEVGGRRLELIVVGPAHTPGDLIVWVPDVRVVFAADVAFIGSTPVIWSGPLVNWLRALETIAELAPSAIVPGHGPVCGVAELEAVGRYLRWLEAATRPHFANGASAYRTAEAIALSDDFARHEWADWQAPERIVINCHSLRCEARGQRKPVTPLRRTLIFEQVGRLAARLRDR